MQEVYVIKKYTHRLGGSRENIVAVTFTSAMGAELVKQLTERTRLRSGEFSYEYRLEPVNFVSGVGEFPEAMDKWV